MAFTLKATTSGSSAVVLATQNGFGVSRWNTPSGERPKPFSTHGAVRIYTPVTLDIVDVVAGTWDRSTVPQVDGGTVGCDVWTYSSAANLEIGSEYLIFFAYSIDSAGEKIAIPDIVQAWPVKDGIVSTPEDGRVSLDEAVAAIRQVPLSPWPPSK